MRRTWFYDLKHTPSESFFADLLAELPDVKVASQIIEKYGRGQDVYCSLTCEKGRDHVRFVLGREYRIDFNGDASPCWWVLVECRSSWWRPCKSVSQYVIPVVEAHIEFLNGRDQSVQTRMALNR